MRVVRRKPRRSAANFALRIFRGMIQLSSGRNRASLNCVEHSIADEQKMQIYRSDGVFPSRAHWKTLLIRRGGKPSDEFLEYCKGVAYRAELHCGRCVDKQGRSCADGPYCERWYLHRCWHTFATMHLQSGVDIRTVSAWLGHKNVKTTMIYLKDARGSDIRRKVNGGLLTTASSPAISTEPRRGQLVAMAR